MEPDPDVVAPLDAADPRYAGSEEARGRRPARRLEASQGPGSLPDNPRARALRVAIPLVVLAAAAAIAFIFFTGLDPGSGQQVVGPEGAVRAAVAGRPHRVCYEGAQPCVWLTVVDDQLLALYTDGPLTEEFGPQGVGWCASSGGFHANATGSRFDAAGQVVGPPAPRGLDRAAVHRDDQGRLVLDFFVRSTGLQAAFVEDPIPPTGPDCAEVPFDREADLPEL